MSNPSNSPWLGGTIRKTLCIPRLVFRMEALLLKATTSWHPSPPLTGLCDSDLPNTILLIYQGPIHLEPMKKEDIREALDHPGCLLPLRRLVIERAHETCFLMSFAFQPLTRNRLPGRKDKGAGGRKCSRTGVPTCQTLRQALHSAPHWIQVTVIQHHYSSCPFPLFSEKPIHFKAPSVSNCNCSFISLGVSGRIIIQTCFGEIGDLLAQLQRKTQKPGPGKERAGRGAVWANFRMAGASALDITRIIFLTTLFFSSGCWFILFHCSLPFSILEGKQGSPHLVRAHEEKVLQRRGRCYPGDLTGSFWTDG